MSADQDARVKETIDYLIQMLDTYQKEYDLCGSIPMEAFVISTAYTILTGEEHSFGNILNDIEFEGFDVVDEEEEDEDPEIMQLPIPPKGELN
jgi:hypothetical protein